MSTYYMDYVAIGRRIATKRRKLRLTQNFVEEQAGLSSKYLSNIEHGRSIPSIDVLMHVADVLHMTPNELLLGSTAEEEIGLDKALVDDILRLTPQKQVVARSLLNWLFEQEI